jgi:hypothetical protein
MHSAANLSVVRTHKMRQMQARTLVSKQRLCWMYFRRESHKTFLDLPRLTSHARSKSAQPQVAAARYIMRGASDCLRCKAHGVRQIMFLCSGRRHLKYMSVGARSVSGTFGLTTRPSRGAASEVSATRTAQKSSKHQPWPMAGEGSVPQVAGGHWS